VGGINYQAVAKKIEQFDFTGLFVNELGWQRPTSRQRPQVLLIDGFGEVTATPVAHMSSVGVLEITSSDSRVPDSPTTERIHRHPQLQEWTDRLLILTDRKERKEPTKAKFSWIRRPGADEANRKEQHRQTTFVRGQHPDFVINRLAPLHIDIHELSDSGHFPVTEVLSRMRQGLGVQKLVKTFFAEYEDAHGEFIKHIRGINDPRDRRWYASVLLNRLMFIWFLQMKGFLTERKGRKNSDPRKYLVNLLDDAKSRGTNLFYSETLSALFFDAFANPNPKPQTTQLCGEVPYLNGGLFLRHGIELKYANIAVDDAAFENIFELFGRYQWSLGESESESGREMSPYVLGYIFEKYINQKEFGAYYTPPQITSYLCRQSVERVILQRMIEYGVHYQSLEQMLFRMSEDECRVLVGQVLPNLSLLDPACGSGAFLLAALKSLESVYGAAYGKAEFSSDPTLRAWADEAKAKSNHDRSVWYFLRRKIITDNLYGVDIMEEAVEIARVRLFLALVASVQRVEQLEPLPNIDFNVLAGNSLVGLLKVDKENFNRISGGGKSALKGKLDYFTPTYPSLVEQKRKRIEEYRHFSANGCKVLVGIRQEIDRQRADDSVILNSLLRQQFQDLKIKFEEETWDLLEGDYGKPIKRQVEVSDIEALQPFHWAYEFDEIVETNGGFDAIITNPPWQVFKPDAKEYMLQHSGIVSKKSMTIKEFEAELESLMGDKKVRKAWLDFRSQFPFQSDWFLSSSDYVHQSSQYTDPVTGRTKKTGSDINLYKLFLERCSRLLRPSGACGIVIPSGIYTDLGAMGLREMLFDESRVTGLVCFENRKTIFEGVDSRFKFVVLSFERGGTTESFPAAFMRHDVAELEQFPAVGSIPVEIDTVRKLSPDSLSVLEFKSPLDAVIAHKMLKFPLLGERIEEKWNCTFGRGFDKTNHRHLFKDSRGPGRIALYEGDMIHQFDPAWHLSSANRNRDPSLPHLWIDEKEGRQAILGKRVADSMQTLPYQDFRQAYRRIASATNERTIISTMLMPGVMTTYGLQYIDIEAGGVDARHNRRMRSVYCTAVFNSFAFDFLVRIRMSDSLSQFFIKQTPVPRLTESDPEFRPIVERAAKLICTTPEFDDLATEVFGKRATHKTHGAIESHERVRLRWELDALVARLYDLTEDEFAHILGTFPLVPVSDRDDTLACYRALLNDNWRQ